MRGQGYDAELAVYVGAFTVAQRQRLEALTAARKLSPNNTTAAWMEMAAWICNGRFVR